ncbi:HU family DNA-binding protein [Streptosporangium canum]|uniref:HU family DNA-binding protein n=1 Tax=Streptosporangium canum TaxID=324952 RepID=UPI003791B489
MVHVPLYLSTPSTEPIREEIRAGWLGAIITPSSGNSIPDEGWWAADTWIFGKEYVSDELNHKPARKGRIPSTGETVDVEESWTPRFAAGAGFKGLARQAQKRKAAAQ